MLPVSGIVNLTSGNSKNAAPIKVLGISFNNAFVKDAKGTYGLTGSLAILRSDDKKKVVGKLLTLGNGGSGNGKQNAYAIALNLPATAQKGMYNLKQADDGEIIYGPNGKQSDLEYAVKSATVNILTNDGKKISGEISGVFVLLDKRNTTQPQQIIVSKLVFSSLEIIDTND